MGIETFIVGIIVVLLLMFVFNRLNLGPKTRCTRCDGTGQVDERWPDPSAPGGWHVVEGKCPKCKGKGKI